MSANKRKSGPPRGFGGATITAHAPGSRGNGGVGSCLGSSGGGCCSASARLCDLSTARSMCSRRSSPSSADLPEDGDERLLHMERAVLKSHNLAEALQQLPPEEPRQLPTPPLPREPGAWAVVVAPPKPRGGPDLRWLADIPPPVGELPPWEASVDGAYANDPLAQEVLRALRNGDRHCRRLSLADCREAAGRLYYQDRLYVPADEALRLRAIRTRHDAPAAGHPGREKTFELLSRDYYWPFMRKDVERYVANCHTCRRVKPRRHAPHGTLLPLPVPNQPWLDIAMDFVVGLPESEGCNAAWVVVDRLSKQRHFVPCTAKISAEGLADLFIRHIFRLHGLPDSIVSDRGPQFASRFWRYLCRCLGIQPRLSTAFHPETDGQTECINASMEEYLRTYVNYLQDDWVRLLPLAEFAGNNQVSSTTGASPFFAVYGRNPRVDFDLEDRVEHPEETPRAAGR